MSSKRSTMATGQKGFIRSHLNQIQDMIDVAEPFTLHDLPFDLNTGRAISRQYQENDIIEKVRRNKEAASCSTQYVWEYRFLPQAKEYAQECLEDRKTLPCGHSAHVHHRDGRYGCKHCQEERDYDRETIVEAL